MLSKLRTIKTLSLAVLLLCQITLAQSSMVVGVEADSLRLSGGAETGFAVGDRLIIQRGTETVGWAEVTKVGDYQTWASFESAQPKVGDRLQLASAVSSERAGQVHRTARFKISTGRGGGGSALNGIFGLAGLYNLVDNQRWANRYGDGFFRTSSTVNLAVGAAGFLFNQFGRNRGPKPQPAKAEFRVSLNEADLQSDVAALSVGLRISNTGWHPLQFGELGEHMFLMDIDGQPIAYDEMSTALLEPIKPGESIEGIVRFPTVRLGKKVRFRFQDILGKDGKVTFRRR